MELISKSAKGEFNLTLPSGQKSIESEIFGNWANEMNEKISQERYRLKKKDDLDIIFPPYEGWILVSVLFKMLLVLGVTFASIFLILKTFPNIPERIVYACSIVTAIVALFYYGLKRKSKIIKETLADLTTKTAIELDNRKHRFCTDPVFFYETVIVHLEGTESTASNQVAELNKKLAQYYTDPRVTWIQMLDQARVDLKTFQDKGSDALVHAAELEKSIPLLEDKINFSSPEEISLLQEIRETESKVGLLQKLVSAIKIKQNFVTDNQALFSRVDKVKELVRPSEYQSTNNDLFDPAVSMIREELEDINSKLDTAIKQGIGVAQTPLLLATTPVNQLIESGTIN